ncbi:hypothetical protein JD844_033038 [Phrynosoma platyrhinos]|uniref:Ig-like domain-containing protein n=1 Tax=Phrynosoma platyrhinos TaxID=52577 RepID=A0ABQ7T6C5_PHRPL|nr:hypothetical protein JD844_033038 [Phrynosoma platyrhinos]
MDAKSGINCVIKWCGMYALLTIVMAMATVDKLMPPELSLTHNLNGTLVCKAVAGKPAAEISWIPAGYYETMAEGLLNGTETITSAYNVTSASEDEVTCIVSHPAWKENRVLTLSLEGKLPSDSDWYLFIWRQFFGIILMKEISMENFRKTDVNALKSPETVPRRLSFQENETQPYATFVQVENVIYDKASDFSPGFSSST